MSEFVTVAPLSDVPEGSARVVEVDGVSLAVCHVAGEGVFAIENRCSHDDGPLGEGELVADRIECPRHGALFDVRSGAPKTLPAVLPVRAYEVRVEDGQIQVALSAVGGGGE